MMSRAFPSGALKPWSLGWPTGVGERTLGQLSFGQWSCGQWSVVVRILAEKRIIGIIIHILVVLNININIFNKIKIDVMQPPVSQPHCSIAIQLTHIDLHGVHILSKP